VSKTRNVGGQNTAREIEDQIETRSGHPTSSGQEEAGAGSAGTRDAMADELLGVSPRSHQHSRKGQAESPRELTTNQPEKKREGHR
jgi:hypothetical protein